MKVQTSPRVSGPSNAKHIASISRITFRFSQVTFFIGLKRSENSLKSQHLVRRGAGGKVMRENEPVLLVLSVFDVKLFLRKVKFYLRNVSLLTGSKEALRGRIEMGAWRVSSHCVR